MPLGSLARCTWQACIALFIIALLLPAAMAIGSEEQTMQVIERLDAIAIKTTDYTITIRKRGFRYSFERSNGLPIAQPHPEAGLRFTAPYSNTMYAAADTRLLRHDDQVVQLEVTTTNGDIALVAIDVAPRMAHFRIVPQLPATAPATPTPEPTSEPTARPSPTPEPTPATAPPNKSEIERSVRATDAVTPTASSNFIIDAQLGRIGKGYGLGDYGDGKALDFASDDLSNLAPLSHARFVTNFSVFPAQGFAQVLFWPHQKRVEVRPDLNRLGVADAPSIDGLYYFIGDLPAIYKTYRMAKIMAGYPDRKPKYAMFEPGWEAYGSLGWNTNQENVQATVQEYLDRGYQFGWAVVGSRTWRGDPNPITAGTTRFGMWDDGAPGSTTPPRYPDPVGFKQFFRDHAIKLIIGLRLNMDKENPFYAEAEQRGYFIKDHIPLIDTHNPEALDWYIAGTNLWGVDGFKEDLCCGQGIKYYDDKVNPANERLMDEGAYVIVRTTAYAVPGDLMRREDTEYEGYIGPPAELLDLGIAYAASAAPNYYPDIIGGTNLQSKPNNEQVRNYVRRNALIVAAMPSMSFGYRPWLLSDDVAADALLAANWHTRMAPYIYSAAVESFESGFPHTMTPMMIAYPNDSSLYDLETPQWMLGPSIMAVGACYQEYSQIGGDECTANVRLPAGTWIDPATGARFEGPTTLEDYPFPLGKIPVFIGGKGVIVERALESSDLTATIYPIANRGSTYRFIAPDGVTISTITNDNMNWEDDKLQLRDVTSNNLVPFSIDPQTGALSFAFVPGHSYRLFTEWQNFAPLTSTLSG